MRKITICGSMSFIKQMSEVKQSIDDLGYIADYPQYENESAGKSDYILHHFDLINNSDAILVINEEKNGVPNYIGGNSFLEMGLAFAQKKAIFLWNPIPEMKYKDEIEAFNPIIINQDLKEIDKYYNSLEKVFIASKSAIKIDAVSFSLQELGIQCNVLGMDCESGIPEQPIGFEETMKGAGNRLSNLKSKVTDECKIFIAIEAGILEIAPNHHIDFNVVLIESEGKQNYALSAGFNVPEALYSEIIEGDLELGPLFMEKYGTKQKDPYIAACDNKIKRRDVISQAVKIAYQRIKTGI